MRSSDRGGLETNGGEEEGNVVEDRELIDGQEEVADGASEWSAAEEQG